MFNIHVANQCDALCRYSDVVDMGPAFSAALKKELAVAIKPLGAPLPVETLTLSLTPTTPLQESSAAAGHCLHTALLGVWI